MDNSETKHRKLESRATQTTPLKQTPLLAVRDPTKANTVTGRQRNPNSNQKGDTCNNNVNLLKA